MKTLKHKIDNKNWHIYNISTKKHILIGDKEKKLLDNKDEAFCEFLRNSEFNIKDKESILNLKFPILTKFIAKNFVTILLEKIILIISSLLFVSFLIWTIIFHFSFTIKIEINFFEYYLISILSIFLHEIFHYIFLINRNVMVPQIGFRIRFLIPLLSMYVDSTGMSFINKKSKIEILFSGILAHLNIYLIFFFLNLIFNKKILLNIATVNLFLLLFNGLWNWSLDGKQIIKVFLNIKNRKKWFNWFDLIYFVALIILFFVIRG